MEATNLINICYSAFIIVFIVLTLLALIMRFIQVLFPEKDSDQDTAILAAISSSFNALYPNTKVTKVEEMK